MSTAAATAEAVALAGLRAVVEQALAAALPEETAWPATIHRAARYSLAAALDGLSPLAVLGRSYALVWDEGSSRLVRDASEVEPGRSLKIRLHKGALRATVQTRESE